MSKMAKSIKDITKDEWILYQWIEVTACAEKERMFIQGRDNTPEEMAKMITNFELIHEYKGEK